MSKAIMIQGTMSNVGKSLITAGLCRIFKQDGYHVAPFKSQNMALNSFITKEGLEMGRAQVMQAEAAQIEPSVCMNPILLKPTNDIGSQVIVNGKVIGNMSAKEYFFYKQQLIPDILKAYQELEENFDIIVIEGAGSPAEINLKQNDIVNMGMAKMAKAPVLLVGDIDRGGVFAQLAGTTLLLDREERALMKGTIINKFRGDKSILDSGVKMIEEIMNIPVVGVTPYIQVDLEEEDSLTERFSYGKQKGQIVIAVIKFPRISNFTDFSVFDRIEQVALNYISKVSQLGEPDMIILPGSKNTMSDLKWLRQSGMETAILKAKEKGSVIFGICGGYQMLGERLIDLDFVEEGGTLRGIGLLPEETRFTKKKTRTRVNGHLGNLSGVLQKLSGMEVAGYEIHMGITEASLARNQENNSLLKKECVAFSNLQIETGYFAIQKDEKKKEHYFNEKEDGCCYKNVYGTYIHGIFDKEGIVTALIEALAEKKGIVLEQVKAVNWQEYKETQYNLLADSLRNHLNIKKIYQILEEGI